MDKRTVKLVMIVAIVLTVALYFIGGTYARYVSTFEGTGEVDVAAWQVKLNEGSDELTLSLTADSNEDVVSGKIAPSYSASGEVSVDLKGTEVSVDVIAEVDESKIQSALSEAGIDVESITTEVTAEKDPSASFDEPQGKGTKDQPYVVKLKENKAFGENDKLKVTITVKWDNKDDAKSTTDTAGGKKAAEGELKLSIPVKLYVVQHIAEKKYEPDA